MLLVNGVSKKEWKSVAEAFWAKTWDMEWACIRFVGTKIVIDTGNEHVDTAQASEWLGRPVSTLKDQLVGGVTYIFGDNDG